MITTMRDEIYISIRVVSDDDLQRADIQELIELLVLFFRLVVSALLVASDMVQTLADIGAILADGAYAARLDLASVVRALEFRLWLAWQIGVILARSLTYGLGVIE